MNLAVPVAERCLDSFPQRSPSPGRPFHPPLGTAQILEASDRRPSAQPDVLQATLLMKSEKNS